MNQKEYEGNVEKTQLKIQHKTKAAFFSSNKWPPPPLWQLLLAWPKG